MGGMESALNDSFLDRQCRQTVSSRIRERLWLQNKREDNKGRHLMPTPGFLTEVHTQEHTHIHTICTTKRSYSLVRSAFYLYSPDPRRVQGFWGKEGMVVASLVIFLLPQGNGTHPTALLYSFLTVIFALLPNRTMGQGILSSLVMSPRGNNATEMQCKCIFKLIKLMQLLT